MNLVNLEELKRIRDELCVYCGIYFLFKDDDIVYIGQSVNIHQRVTTHKNNQQKDFDSYSYVLCDKEDLMMYETAYLIKFKPKYNISCRGKLNLPKPRTMVEFIADRIDLSEVANISREYVKKYSKIQDNMFNVTDWAVENIAREG